MAELSTRRYRMWEEEMLGEYTARHLPHARIMTRVRLGPTTGVEPNPTLTFEERVMVGAAWRRWADAVAVYGGALYVLELAMLPDPRDISLLETYCALVPSTPELEEFRALPCRGRLVWAIDDPFSRTLAVKHGLEVVIFRPSNWREWISVKRARESRAAVTLLPLGDAP